MDKKIYISIIVVLIASALGILAYNYLEVYEYKKYIFPSKDVNTNIYYALEQWLIKTGHQVRYESKLDSGELASLTEKVIIVNSRALSGSINHEIIRWIENGGHLNLYIDLYGSELEKNISSLLSKFGITYEFIPAAYLNPKEEDAEESENESDADVLDNMQEITEEILHAASEIETADANQIDFQSNTAFTIENEEGIFLIRDEDDIIRLVEVPIGEGALTVTGLPVFMNNYNIEKEANASLAWRLTGYRDEGAGILFIRTSFRNTSNSIIETIMKNGNIIPAVIASVILIITGFWMVIPAFGFSLDEKQRNSRPLKDRFEAEIQFLKKYRRLNHYLKAYERDQNSDKEKSYTYRELINQYRRLIDGTKKL
ncbi:MAG: hypothetical protein FWC22_02600 [Treponema sp.]|nr:hypothetical protein [Treponema sp.]